MNHFKSNFVTALCAGLLTSTAMAADSDYQHFNWDEVAPGVWFGLSKPNSFQSGNVAIVTLPGGGELVVDTQDSDFLGREILAKAKEVGHGPVKYVVNTHLHQDHVGGNVAFVDDNPKVQIIAHKNTCTGIPQKTVPRMRERIPALTKGLEDLRAKRVSIGGNDKDAAALDLRITGTSLYLADARDFRWAMPNMCLNLKAGQEKVINEVGRRIEIHYFGRAHSTGDLAVYLPKERVAMVGDLWGQDTGYKFLDAGLDGRDGSALETPATLKGVRSLNFDVALTGHSAIIHGKASLDEAISDGEQIIAEVRSAVESGQTATALLQKMPPPDHAPPFVADVWRNTVINAFEEIQLREELGLPLPDSTGDERNSVAKN
ncbi:MBL fold metallo-hydrolase [Caballeronia sp. AZ7_KS35]|uniref:MBL fold metallo-hydrolase n=1 Tax=Caballeronia sp. AZ7_KS35 TaxID=2921762 RepID=UPI0020282637|nr:MBL fold metallo-hydrolase [Caballeronia sp. AZ7_KS35]